MKKFFKITAVIAVLFTSVNAFAIESDLKLKVNETNGKNISFTLKGNQTVGLEIYNPNDMIVLSEKIFDKKTINRTYNLEHLTVGTYFLVVSDAEKTTRYQINITEDKAELVSSPIKEDYKVTFQSKGNFMKLKVLNVTKPVKISIFDDENDTLLYTTTEEVENGNVSKKFSFENSYINSKINGRSYLIKVEYENGTVDKWFFAE